jgi:hypothetical protein
MVYAARICRESGSSCRIPAAREEAPLCKRLKRAAIVFTVVVVAAQFVRPGRANPPLETSRTIAAHGGASSAAVAVLDRSCSDCHSNRTVWRWSRRSHPCHG